jgi:type 2 lantibiotic biosynthesis protein LanM
MPLEERLPDGVPAAGARSDVAARRLDAWCGAVGRGDADLLAARLQLDGLDPARALSFLDGPAPKNGGPPPAWAGTLVRVLALARSERGRTVPYRFFDPADPLPFEEIVAPFVLAAAEQVGDIGDDVLAEEACSELERFLLARLTGFASRAFHLEFTLERHARLSPIGRLLARSEDAPGRTLYEQFARRMRGGALADFFREYPVLARLMSRVTDLWVEATIEFGDRLVRDRDELRRIFGAAGRVTALEPGLSDPHRGGRTVIGLTFASGTKVVYKPKDVGTEVAYNRLLAWLNERGSPLEFSVLELIDRPAYGWVEWVEHEPCRDEEELRRYYRRAGMLVCLVYALAGTDCHRENLIACGEHPVLVDAETLMHHRLRAEQPVRAWNVALDQLTGGVLGTGLLPSWQAEDESGEPRASDISALHTAVEEELVEHRTKWEHTNTDGMVLRSAPILRPVPKNQPLLGRRRARLEEHASEVMAGFERMYSFLLERREQLLAPGSPLDELMRQRVRFIFRNTRVYGALHNELRDPVHLRDGIDRSIHLERLGRTASPDGKLEGRWWPLVEAEKEAMEQLDIPLFTAPADGVALNVAPGRDIDGCLREPSAELVVERLRALGREDLERQLGFVAGSLHSNTARHGDFARPVEATATRRPRAGLEEAAIEVADEIAERAIRAPGDSGAVWIAPHYKPRLERYQLQPIGLDLHSGACGIALFLAAVERVTERGDYGQLALAALEPLHEALAQGPDALADAVGLGAATGLGSVVYAVTRISDFLEEPDLLAAAAAAAAALTEERIADARPDVFTGLAGEILGQLALYDRVGDADLLERAARCGGRLLDTRVPRSGRRRA